MTAKTTGFAAQLPGTVWLLVLLTVWAVGASCSPRGSGGGGGGAGGNSSTFSQQLWIRNSATAENYFLQTNRSNHCSRITTFYEDTVPEYSAALDLAWEDLSDGTIDANEYELRYCEAYRDYYTAYADLHSTVSSTTISSSFSVYPEDFGDDDDSAGARGWTGQDPEPGTYVSQFPITGEFDGTFSGSQTERGPDYLSAWRNIECVEGWNPDTTTKEGLYEDYLYGSISGVLVVSAASDTAFRLQLSDGEYSLYNYFKGLDPESSETRSLVIDGIFELCQVGDDDNSDHDAADDDDTTGDDDDSALR